MLDNIDKNQRHKLRMDGRGTGSPDRHRALRHQMSNENMIAPPFNIPNLRVEKRKTSSAEDMARKNSASGPSPISGIGAFKNRFTLGKFISLQIVFLNIMNDYFTLTGKGIGQWFFGSSSTANNDNNFLRVGNASPNRRLSDNTLMTPKIRIAPSCSSSPGGTPGGNSSGLPTRRHSSIGPQERRASAVNLSPPTVSDDNNLTFPTKDLQLTTNWHNIIGHIRQRVDDGVRKVRSVIVNNGEVTVLFWQGYQIRGRGGSGSSLSVPASSRAVVS